MNRDRVMLVVYLAAVVAATLVHDVRFLAAGLAVTLALAGRNAWRVARRALAAVAAFTLVVLAGYVALSWWRGSVAWGYFPLVITRVVWIACMSILFASRVNPLRALDFSRTLVYVMSLAYSQAQAFRRLHTDFRLAFTSRSAGRIRARDRYRHAASTASFFLRRALVETGDVTLAMTSRGFFDDPD